MNKLMRRKIVISVSFILALLLTIIPLPDWANWFRPLWVLMVLSYWALALELYEGLGFAFFAGILLDVLGGTLFGEHAVAMVICIYIVMRLKRQLLMYSLEQHALFMLFLTFVYQGVIFLIEGFAEHTPQTFFFLAPLITTPLFWPWIFILLRDCRRRFKVT